MAAHAGLPYVKINPLDLDLDVVTKGIAGPFARKHGLVAICKTTEKITVAVYDPFRPFPTEDIKRVTGLDVERVVATRSRRGDDQPRVLRPQGQPEHRGEAAHRRPPLQRRPRQPGVPLRGVEGARPGGGARGQGPRPHPELRLRAARLRHPLRAQARPHPGAPAHRRDPARRAPHPEDRLPGGGLAHQAPLGGQPGREAPARRTGASSASRAGARSSCASPPCPPPSARRRCSASSTPTSS